MKRDDQELDCGSRPRDLVQRFGSEFEQLVQDHRRELREFVVRNGISSTDADEPVDDALMAAFVLMKRTGEALQNPRGFLFRAVIFRMTDYLRDRYRREGQLEGARREAEITARFDPPDITAVIDDRAQLAGQKRAICALPTRQREAFLLHHYYDFDVPEIAEVMGISRQAARTHVARAETKFSDLAGEEQAS